MKRTVTIRGCVSGVIPTAAYANLKPGFTWEETLEDCDMTDAQIEARQKWLYNKCCDRLREAEQTAIIDRIEREREDLRFVKSPATGRMLPSVTSILNYDADFFVSPIELQQYASQGTIVHAQVREYIKTGEWKAPKEIEDIWADLVILAKGDLKLPAESGDFRKFLEKYPIEQMKNGFRLFNDDIGYCGEPDFIGVPVWEDAANVLTVFDVKRTLDKIKNGMQLSAYAKLLEINGTGKIEQGIIVILNDKTKQRYSKPVIYTQDTLAGYWKMFLRKREDFRKRYKM